MSNTTITTGTRSLSLKDDNSSTAEDGRIFEGSTSIPLLDFNIGELLDEQARRHPGNEAVVSLWQGKRSTYKELRSSARDIAGRLLANGVKPGDRVVVLAGNTMEYSELFFAVGGIGAIFSIINPTFTPEEIMPAIDFLDPAAIFMQDKIGYRKNANILNELSKRQDPKPLVVQLVTSQKAQKPGEGVLNWDEFMHQDLGDCELTDLDEIWGTANPKSTMCIQFTSGTTGARKAAMVSHESLLNNALLVGTRLEYTSEDRVCCCSPIYHCFGLVCELLAPFVFAGTAVIPSDVFLAESSLEALSKEKCTVIHAVSAMLQAMLDHPDAPTHARDIGLRTGIIAGSSFSDTLVQRLSKEFRFNGLAYGYGMTELGCIVFLTIPSEVSLLDDRSSVGKVMPHTAAKVVDEELNTLSAGSSGELLVSGYLAFQGYYKNEDKTRETKVKDEQGREWVRTGDLVTIDESGRCTIIGRVKDMMKKDGENIFPSDIEKALEEHPDVMAATVVGVPNIDHGEVVGAFVQRAKESSSEAPIKNKDLKAYLRKKIAVHKVPDHFFWIGEDAGVPDTIPVNATGKVVKTDLRNTAVGIVGGA